MGTKWYPEHHLDEGASDFRKIDRSTVRWSFTSTLGGLVFDLILTLIF